MINPVFSTFLSLPDTERHSVFQVTREKFDMPLVLIEKDLWACHVLDALFNSGVAEQPRLLFRGGTSLSKVYNVIRRFSEDIDITVFREDLKFTGDNDPANPELGSKRRRRLVEALVKKTAGFIQEELSNTLKAHLHDCNIRPDPNDKEGMTLFVEYDSLYKPADESYVQPRIKIEGGARSALEPHSMHAVSPYIQSQLVDYNLSVPGITTIDAERTFLDKLLILHGWHCGYRDQGRLPIEGRRLSRHYYDIATMATTLVAENAINNTDLFNNVISHAQLLFRRGWMKLDEIATDGIKLVPQDGLNNSLEADYKAMQEMLFGNIPSFSQLVDNIGVLEQQLNEIILGETNSTEIPTQAHIESTVTPSP